MKNLLILVFFRVTAYFATGTLTSDDLKPRVTPDMVYIPLPESTSPGGRCMDGTMAGYYIREGSNPSLFVIHLKGGGGCTDKEECDKRATLKVGSSADWSNTKVGTRLLAQDCTKNPTFCEATAIHIPYCTSDSHRGVNDEPSEESWGYYFDGHLNFQAIVEKLVSEKGLGAADNVLLTGGSAGAIGALFNVDWLADRLPNANVKVVPFAGWYMPAALPDDLPLPHTPSDYTHFSIGIHGNPTYDLVQSGIGVLEDNVWKVKETLSADCLAAFSEEEWWACASAHYAYKYIRSPIYLVHTQFDRNQIFHQNFAPQSPSDDSELDTVKKYTQMWGNSTRTSFEMTIMKDDVLVPKSHQDGLFAASCISHGTLESVSIDGQYYMDLIHDWFFQTGQFNNHYKLIESCLPLEGNEDYVIPCNTHPTCEYQPMDDKTEVVRQCASELSLVGCLQPFGPRSECYDCARSNKETLYQAGCTEKLVGTICNYVENNEIHDEFEGENIVPRDEDFNLNADHSGIFSTSDCMVLLKSNVLSLVGITMLMTSLYF